MSSVQAFQMDQIQNDIEKAKVKTIPLPGDNNRAQNMRKVSPIFEAFASFCETTPKNTPLHMRVWCNKNFVNGFKHSEIYFSEHMEDKFGSGVIFGITFGTRGYTGKYPTSFVGDMQIRFMNKSASVTTWHNSPLSKNQERFRELMDEFTNLTHVQQLLADETSNAQSMFDGHGIVTPISINTGLLLTNYWKQMITPMIW